MKPRTRALVISLIASQMALTLPWLLFTGPGDNPLGGTATLAVLSILVASAMGSRRLALLLVGPLTITAGLAVLWAELPVLAGLLIGAATFARGYLSRQGLQNALTMSIVTLAFTMAQPTPASATGSWPPALATAGVVLVSGAWTLLLLWLTRRYAPTLPRRPVDDEHALWFAIITAVLTGAAAWLVSANELAHAGGWFILTILVVMQPFAKDSMRKACQRAGGTASGFAAAFVVGALIDGTAYQKNIAVLIGTGALLMAMYLMLAQKPYWHYAAFLTLGIVLLEGAATSVLRTDELRLVATLAGVAVSIGATALLITLGRRLARPEPDAASQK